MSKLLEVIARQEGFRPDVYRDSEGYWTIGCGCLISKELTMSEAQARSACEAPWTLEQAKQKLAVHVAEVQQALSARLPYFDTLPELVRWGLIDMGYQLGVRGVLMFTHMLAAIEAGRYAEAERDALNSLWAHQTPNRAKEVAAWIGNHE